MLLRIFLGGLLFLILCSLTAFPGPNIANALPEESAHFFGAATVSGKYLKALYPVFAAPGGLALLATLLGISLLQRRKTERALVKSQNLFRSVADLAHDWESWVNPHGQFVYTSPSCERVTGYSARQFMEDSTLFERIIHLEDRTAFRDQLAESAARGVASNHPDQYL